MQETNDGLQSRLNELQKAYDQQQGIFDDQLRQAQEEVRSAQAKYAEMEQELKNALQVQQELKGKIRESTINNIVRRCAVASAISKRIPN